MAQISHSHLRYPGGAKVLKLREITNNNWEGIGESEDVSAYC